MNLKRIRIFVATAGVACGGLAAAQDESATATDIPAPTQMPVIETSPADTGDENGALPDVGDNTAGLDMLDQTAPVADDASSDAPATGNVSTSSEAAEDPAAETSGVGPTEFDGLTERQRLAQEFARFRELKSSGMLDEAENAAKSAVEMAISVSGPGSDDTAKALHNLATVQYDERNYEAAQQNFQAAIDIFTDNADKLSDKLINPLRGLGAAQLEGGRPDLAEKTYGQAVHISHVNEGPHNLDQLPILETLAETRLRLGETEQAKETQDMIYALTLRHLSDDGMAIIPPLMRRAAWQKRTGYINDERATYSRIIRIIEHEKGKDDVALIDPLIKLGESHFKVSDMISDSSRNSTILNGEIYFKRAVRIAEEQPEPDWHLLAKTKLALADYYNYREDYGRSRRTYAEVWELLSQGEAQLALRHETLETVHALNEDPLPKYRGGATLADIQTADKGIREGSVIVAYDVSSRGRIDNLEVIESKPEELEEIRQIVVREVRNLIFRPRFENGEPVETTNQIFSHDFYYQQETIDNLRAEAAGDADKQ